MIKRIVETRVNKLLDELEAISNRYIVDTSKMTVIQKAVAMEVHPEDLKRIFTIRMYLNILNMLFKEEE